MECAGRALSGDGALAPGVANSVLIEAITCVGRSANGFTVNSPDHTQNLRTLASSRLQGREAVPCQDTVRGFLAERHMGGMFFHVQLTRHLAQAGFEVRHVERKCCAVARSSLCVSLTGM